MGEISYVERERGRERVGDTYYGGSRYHVYIKRMASRV